MQRLLTKEELTKLLAKKPTIEIKTDGKTLFNYCRSKNTVDLCEQEHKHTVLESMARVTGLVDHRCEYYPILLNAKQGLKFDGLNIPGFAAWFMNIIENRTVALDSGVIMHHLISRVVIPHLKEYKKIDSKLRFLKNLLIPRLTIIEIEDKYNRAKAKTSDRRLMIYALTELQLLKTLGAKISANLLPTSVLADFRTAAGSHYADAFIRREIMESNGTLLPVFVTRDLMNAMAASAEGIDSLYFAIADTGISAISITPEQFVESIIEAAITFSEIEMYDASAKTSILLEGMWSGKTNIDWFDGRLRMKN
jgi:hypothetical protein